MKACKGEHPSVAAAENAAPSYGLEGKVEAGNQHRNALA